MQTICKNGRSVNLTSTIYKLISFCDTLKVWDKELAKLAGMNTRKCKFGHDACRNTGNASLMLFNPKCSCLSILLCLDKYLNAGQNIAIVSAHGRYPIVKKTIYKIVHDMWFLEYKHASMKFINRYDNRRE